MFVLYVLKEKPNIRTFDAVSTPGYEKELSSIVKAFKRHGYERDTSKPDLLAVLMGDGGIIEEGKKHIDSIILGIKRPPKGKTISRGILTEVKNWKEVEEYIDMIDRGEYHIAEYTGVDIIDMGKRYTAFNEVSVQRDNTASNQAMKFYVYCIRESKKTPYKPEKIKLFSRNFPRGPVVGDGVVIGTKLGYRGYQRPTGVPIFDRGMGVGVNTPNVEKEDLQSRLIERLFGKQTKMTGFVAPPGSVIEFELIKGEGIIHVDHDLIRRIVPEESNTFQVMESEKRMSFLKFKPSLPPRLYGFWGRRYARSFH